MEIRKGWVTAVMVLMISAPVMAQRVTVVVRDYAGIEAHVLRRAEAETARIFGMAGVELTWISCSEAQPSESECGRPPRGVVMVIDLVHAARISQQPGSRTIGYTLPDESGLYGSRVRVVYDFAKRLQSSPAGSSIVLGDTMAHELGHLLLGPNSHAPTGIMKAHWHGSELLNAAQGGLVFQTEEQRRIRQNIVARSRGGS